MFLCSCHWLPFPSSCRDSVTLVYSGSVIGFGLHSVMYMDGVLGPCCTVCAWGGGGVLSTADSDFTSVQSLLLAPVSPPPFFFFTQGENEEEQNQHMKTKTWQRRGEEEGRGGRGEKEQRKKRQSQKTRGFSKVRMKASQVVIFEKWSLCSAALKSRYTLFYLPDET